MRASFISKEINTVKIEMEITAEEFEATIDEVFKKNKNRFSVPGFRKGKATRKMIESHYGKDIFIEDAINEIFNKEYPKALNELGFEPVNYPDIDLDGQTIEAGKDINLKISFLVAPEFTVENYKGVEVKIPKMEVTDEDINKQLDSYARRNSRLITVDREAKKDDTLIFDYKGFIHDDVQFEGGTAENAKLRLGSNQFIPGFEDQLIGVKAGEERTITVTFPVEYPSEEVAGEIAKFECKIHEVKEEEVPPIDDELATECSEYDTLDEWKVEIEKQLKENQLKMLESRKQNEAMNKIYENTVVDIPEVMIEHEIDSLLEQFDQQLRYSGMNLQNYLSSTKTDLSEFREQVRDEAEKKVKTRLIIENIAKQENISVTEEEIDETLSKMSIQYGMDLAKMKDMVGSDIKFIEKDICSRKAFELIAENAVVEWIDADEDAKASKSEE